MNNFWYQTLIKPTLTPPAWVFAPVWTVLYIMMAVAFILMLVYGKNDLKIICTSLFLVQLILNLCWSPIFFGMHNIKLSVIIIMILWVFVLATGITFYLAYKPSAILLIPYFIWLNLATYLNIEILRLN